MDEIKAIERFDDILVCIYFGLLLSLVLAVFIKLRFNVDKTAILIQCGCLLSMFFRLPFFEIMDS